MSFYILMLKSCCKDTNFYLNNIYNREKYLFNLSANFFDLSNRFENIQKKPHFISFYRRKGLKTDKMAVFPNYDNSEGFSLLSNVNEWGGGGQQPYPIADDTLKASYRKQL